MSKSIVEVSSSRLKKYLQAHCLSIDINSFVKEKNLGMFIHMGFVACSFLHFLWKTQAFSMRTGKTGQTGRMPRLI